MQILIHRHRPIRWLFFAALLSATSCLAQAETLVAPEYKIKAAFLYNFTKLTEWPTNMFVSSNAPIVIGVIGKDPFGRLLDDTVKGKIIQGRKIVIERFNEPGSGLAKCHLLFIAKPEEERLAEIFSLVATRPVLTVSEIDRFNYKGGMIWLVKKEDEIKFRIRQSLVRESGLTLSSKLLALAVNATAKQKGKK